MTLRANQPVGFGWKTGESGSSPANGLPPSSSCGLVLDECCHLLLRLLAEGQHGAVGRRRAAGGKVVEGLLGGAAETLETLGIRTDRPLVHRDRAEQRNEAPAEGWGYLRQVSRRGDQSVDGPDGEEGDG